MTKLFLIRFGRLVLASAVLFIYTVSSAQTAGNKSLQATRSANSRNIHTTKKQVETPAAAARTASAKPAKKASKAELNMAKRLPKNYDDSKTNITSKP